MLIYIKDCFVLFRYNPSFDFEQDLRRIIMQAVVLTTLAVLVVSLAGPSLGRSPPRAGGLSEVKPADPQIRLLVKSVSSICQSSNIIFYTLVSI